ncbi:leucyl aminopeptidase family protein [Paenibacillus sp. LHD-38]|uniref:leucyl aminopeptidase family protein n=1 Tax=Paenibacillus sp. LHD-38 TaxID=3072143 RepID=UPI00280C4CC2|nr:leucyl aminopeptidase family protein [Paenibacillus sp. LHD-38]MDQ8734720.1 leucyl aminopeptidase family protein [Paenibacillus sp. LHD-38]
MKGHFGKFEDGDAVIYPLFKEDIESGIPAHLNAADMRDVEVRSSAGEKDALTWMFRQRGKPGVLLVGLGEKSKADADLIRNAAGNAGRAVMKDRLERVHVSLNAIQNSPLHAAETAGAWMEGWMLGTYTFHKYKSAPADRVVPPLRLDVEQTAETEEQVRMAMLRAEGTLLARDLANEPPNELRPEMLARRVQEHFANTPVEVEVLSRSTLEKEGMAGLLAVGRGSRYAPLFIKMTYISDSSKPLIALVGKGITFDTGGISLKKDYNISDMRMDMAGGASVIGAMDILSRSGAPLKVVALIPAAENMPGGNALLPGEILTYANGLTVQIGNTDAEGRLVLADALLYAHRLGARDVADIATLTYSCTGALGSKYAGVFGDQSLVDSMRDVSARVGEKVWQLPLADEYESYLDSDCADICNVSSVGEAGAITAALFLRRFVDPSMKWVHLDMAGLKDASATKGHVVHGATGFGTRLLAEWVLSRTAHHERSHA